MGNLVQYLVIQLLSFYCFTVLDYADGLFLDSFIASLLKTTTTTRKPFILDLSGDQNCPRHLPRDKYLVYNTVNNVCYQFVINKRGNWNNAKSDCEGKGGNLVVIRDWEINYFIQLRDTAVLFHKDQFMWIGLSDINQEGNFEWVTNERVSYTHWEYGYPRRNTFDNSQDCVAFDNHELRWVDHDCSNQYAWICEYDVNAKPPITSAVMTTYETTKTTRGSTTTARVESTTTTAAIESTTTTTPTHTTTSQSPSLLTTSKEQQTVAMTPDVDGFFHVG